MNKYSWGIIPLLIILAGIFSSCEEEIFSAPSLVTEEVLFVSGDRARILGRIITTQNISAVDHGFYLAQDESFSQPLIISLGERQQPGRFIGETGDLKIADNYFVKAYIDLGNEVQFGNVITLQTLDPAVFDFAPANGKGGSVIFINGKNFTADTKVFFGDQPAEILKISFESRISVKVPPIANKSSEKIRVISQGKEMILPLSFEYTTGKFIKLNEFPRPEQLLDNIYFQQGNQFFVGLGSNKGLSFFSQIWKFDLGSNVWQNTNYPGQPSFMSFFSQNYFGSGAVVLGRAPYVTSRNFWKTTNESYQKLPDLPFEEANSAAFEINNNLYVAGGIIHDSLYIHRYNIASGNWVRLKNAPFPISNNLINFTYQNKQYFINPANRQLVSFDPITENWNVITTYPGEFTGGGFGLAVGDKVYIGLFNRSVQVWELNMNNLNWVRKNDFTGSPIAKNAGVYVFNGIIYILRSPEIQISRPMELWSFDPSGF